MSLSNNGYTTQELSTIENGTVTSQETPSPVEQQVQTDQTNNGVDRRQMHNAKLYKLGIVEILLGIISIALWALSIALAVNAPPNCNYGSCFPAVYGFVYVSSGVWCGMFLLISGGLAICTRKKPSDCMYKANLAMSIISAFMMSGMVAMSAIAAAFDSTYDHIIPALYPHIALAVVGFSAMIVAIVHSVFCCIGTCCRFERPPGQVKQHAYGRTGAYQQYSHSPRYGAVFPFSRDYAATTPRYYYQPNQAAGPCTRYPMTSPGMPVNRGYANASYPQPMSYTTIPTISGGPHVMQDPASQRNGLEAIAMHEKTDHTGMCPVEPPDYATASTY